MCTIVYQGSLSGHKGPITSVVAPQGPIDDTVFSASHDKTIIIWDITREGESNYNYPRLTLEGHEDVVQDIALAPVTESLASASWDKTLRLWDTDKGDTLTTFEGHSDKVYHVSFTNRGRQIISSSIDKTLKVWGFSGRCQDDFTPSLKQQQSNDGNPTHFCFTPNDAFIFSVGNNVYYLDYLNTMMVQPAIPVTSHKNAVNTIAISHDGNYIVSSCKEDSQVIVFNSDRDANVGSLDTGSKEINALSFSPDNYWLAVADESSIQIWDVKSKMKLAAVDIPSNCTTITWSGNGYSIYSGHSDNLIRAWEVDRPE